MKVAPILRNRDFTLNWCGFVFSQIGTRGTVTANLYHVYTLTDSIWQTGLVGGAQAVALVLLSPLGGAYADRKDPGRPPASGRQRTWLTVRGWLVQCAVLGGATHREPAIS